MSEEPKPHATGQKTERDQAAFEKLPENTKELMKLKDQEEKTTGPEQVATTRKIHNKARNKKE